MDGYTNGTRKKLLVHYMKKALGNAYLETPPADGDKCTY